MVDFRRGSVAIAILVAVLLTGMGSSAALGAAVLSTTIGTTPRDIVYNAPVLRKFVEAAKTRRIDIAAIGDSNQVGGGGYGWDHGYAKAWSDRFGLYATSQAGMFSWGGWNGPAGYIDQWGGPYLASSTDAPAELHKYKLFYNAAQQGNDFPANYGYFPSGYTENPNFWNPTFLIFQNSKLYGQDLTWHLTYGTFPDGAGEFTPNISTAYQTLVRGERVVSSTGFYGLRETELSVPYSVYQGASQPISFAVSELRAETLKGPFFGLWQRVEGNRTSGVAYSTTVAQGGRALVHAASALQAQTPDAFKTFVRNLVSLQNGPPMLMVDVKHGGNDAGMTIPSVGPNPAPSNTPAGFADDMHAVILRWREAWESCGYDMNNLMFTYGPYHPIEAETYQGSGVTAIERLSEWEESIVALSQQHPEYNLAVVRGTRVTTPRTMASLGWYDNQGQAHLTPDGYIGFAEIATRQMVGYAVPEDFSDRSNITSLSVTFDSDVSALLTPDDLVLHERSGHISFEPGDLAVDWDPDTFTATWTFQGLPMGELPIGEYEATVLTSQLDGAIVLGNGVLAPRGDFTFSFIASVPEPTAVGLAGAAAGRRRR